MKPIIAFVLTLVSLVSSLPAGAVISAKDSEKALRELDRLLTVRAAYRATRQARIDSLRGELRSVHGMPDRKMDILRQLGESYTAFNNDSALYFYGEGIRVANQTGSDSMAMLLHLNELALLPLAGFCREATDQFAEIDTASVPRDLMAQYYLNGAQMYSYIASFYRKHPDVYDANNAKVREMRLGLVSTLDSSDKVARLNKAEIFYDQGEFAKAGVILKNLFDELDENDNCYARAAYYLAGIARANGLHDENIYYLARSAMGDVKSATLEVTSLQSLGSALFGVDDVNRANTYLTAALENAVDCHAMLRINETSESMPLISEAHSRAQRSNHAALIAVMCIMVVLLVGMIVLVVFLRSEMKQLLSLERGLRDANRVKDVYISQFLNLCSIYMDKLNSFCKIAQRKITAGKVDDLYKMTKSGKFVEEQSREFYEVFDDAFLHIYPTFLKDVNRLLRDDEQIELREGEKLNTDLRILAFMRLGIEESARIAQMLNYSVYTIYTYRNKLKNRAKRRETFESDVMLIGAVD